jgi:K+-transporting ATPase ATPase C chain
MKNLLSDLRLSVLTLLLFGVMYPLFFVGIGRFVPQKAEGSPVVRDGKVVGFAHIGQAFTADRYFHGRPSATGYNAAATGGSNKGPSNQEYLAEVRARRDSLLAQNPGISASQIPSGMVTASGSGIDPDISPEAARIQVKRVAAARDLPEAVLLDLIDQQTQPPLLGIWGKNRINVLQLNLALDEIQ